MTFVFPSLLIAPKPNWAFWHDVPAPLVREAVILAFNYEPHFALNLHGGTEVYSCRVRDQPLIFGMHSITGLACEAAIRGELSGFATEVNRELCSARIPLAPLGKWIEPRLPKGLSLPDQFPRLVPAEVDKGQQIKRAALIERHVRQWPTMQRDLKDSSANGLRAEAKADGQGWWHEGAALAWATARGKITVGDPAAASVFARTTVHKIRR